MTIDHDPSTTTAAGGGADAGPSLAGELAGRLRTMAEAGTVVELAVRLGPPGATTVVGIPLDGRRLVIGRRDADLVVDHPVVSRRHAELWCAGAQLFVADAGSRNGTWVRRAGLRIDAATATEVFQGDQLLTADGVVVLEIGRS